MLLLLPPLLLLLQLRLLLLRLLQLLLLCSSYRLRPCLGVPKRCVSLRWLNMLAGVLWPVLCIPPASTTPPTV
jgi:hypothetical protein